MRVVVCWPESSEVVVVVRCHGPGRHRRKEDEDEDEDCSPSSLLPFAAAALPTATSSYIA